jgi:hypothetical protein
MEGQVMDLSIDGFDQVGRMDDVQNLVNFKPVLRQGLMYLVSCMGTGNPWVFCGFLSQVWVQVAIFGPVENPYP